MMGNNYSLIEIQAYLQVRMVKTETLVLWWLELKQVSKSSLLFALYNSYDDCTVGLGL